MNQEAAIKICDELKLFQTKAISDAVHLEFSSCLFNEKNLSITDFGKIENGKKVFTKRELEYDEDDKKYHIKDDQIRVILIGTVRAENIEKAVQVYKNDSSVPHFLIDEYGGIHLLLPLEMRAYFANEGYFGNLTQVAVPGFGGIVVNSIDFISISIDFLSKNGQDINKAQISAYEKLLIGLRGIFLRLDNILLKKVASDKEISPSFLASYFLKSAKIPEGMRLLPKKRNSSEHEDIVDFFYKISHKNFKMVDLQRIGGYLSNSGFKIMNFNKKDLFILEFSSAICGYILTLEPKFFLLHSEIFDMVKKISGLPIFYHLEKLVPDIFDNASKTFGGGDMALSYAAISMVNDEKIFEIMSQMNPKELQDWVQNLRDGGFLERRVVEIINDRLKV